MDPSPTSFKGVQITEYLSQNLGSLNSEDRRSRSGKPISVAGYRERRQASFKKLKKERTASDYCLETSSMSRSTQAASCSVPITQECRVSPMLKPLDLTKVNSGLSASRASAIVVCKKSKIPRERCMTWNKDSEIGSVNSKFRSRLQRLRMLLSCLVADSDRPEKSRPHEESECTSQEKEASVKCCKGGQSQRDRNSITNRTYDRSDSARSSRIKACFSSASEGHGRKAAPFSATFARLFRTNVVNFKSATPRMLEIGKLSLPKVDVGDEFFAGVTTSVSPRPSPTAVRRCRRQETLVRMMEKELAEHNGTQVNELNSSTRRTITEIKHNTAPARDINSKPSRSKTRKIRGRSSSKKGTHKRCATC